MESAHVLIRLCDDAADPSSGSRDTSDASSPSRNGVVGVRRTSATSVRLEHSDMSPGVASISFEQVFDARHSNAQIFEQSLADAVGIAVQEGTAMTVVATGAARTGKSFTMHGGQDGTSMTKGLIELAIERVLAVLSEYHEWQVLLSAAFTRRDEDENGGSMVDAFTDEPFTCDPVDEHNIGVETFLSRAVRVVSVTEAITAYKRALDRCTQADETTPTTDFVCMLLVESRAKSGRIRRSRVCFMDIHRNTIIEPSHADDEVGKPALFAETHFPVNKTLSKWCGWALGNESCTYQIVSIHTSTRKHQEAIQALLYACKAKEIKSIAEVCEVDAFSVAPAYPDLKRFDDEPENQDRLLMLLGSPISSTSSNSTTKTRPQNASDRLSERLRQACQSVKSSSRQVPVKMPPPLKPANASEPIRTSHGANTQTMHARVDEVLRTIVSKKNKIETMTLLEKLEVIVHQYRDMEKSLQHETSVKKKCVERISKLSQTMSFQVVEHDKQVKARDIENKALRAQLETMQTKYDDAEQTLESLQTQVEAMKLAMQERANARSPAKASNERLLLQQFSARLETAMLEAKAVVDHKDAMIRELDIQVKQLQEANGALEKSLASMNARISEEERDWRSKQIKWKEDEARLVNELSKMKIEVSRWMDEASRLEKNNTCLVEEITGLKADKDRWNTELGVEWAEKQAQWKRKETMWNDEQTEWYKDKAELEAALALCRGELVEESSKATYLKNQLGARNDEWSMRISELEKTIESGRQEVATLRSSELDQKTRIAELETMLHRQVSEIAQINGKHTALEAAKLEAERQVHLLQTALEEIQAASVKEKKKLEKKLRILMSERKQQIDEAEKAEREMASEVRRLGLELEVTRSECLAKGTELEQNVSLLSEIRGRISQLEQQHSVNQEQIVVLHECNKKLEADKQALQAELDQLEEEKRAISEELDRRTYALEQRAARQLVEQESRISADHEHTIRDMMERHSAEMLQRDLELRRLRSRRQVQQPPAPSSSSSSSSSSSEYKPHTQHDLDQLNTVTDDSRSSPKQQLKKKRLEDKIAKQKQKIAALREQLDSITHALAVANEQESLAKAAIEQQQALYERMMYAQEELQTQVNALKEENWSLNLALQVCERRGHDSKDGNQMHLPMSSRIAEC